MSTLTDNHKFTALATNVKINNELITVYLEDGRVVSVPIAYFPKLINASDEQRQKWRLIDKGQGICWEEIDEDISVEGLLRVD